jgi:methylated-DNA-[protein]-cysteine S-methyltransferase
MEPPGLRQYIIEVSSGFVHLSFSNEGIYSLSLMRVRPLPAKSAATELYWPELEQEIRGYFNGFQIKGDYPLIMSGYSPWTKKILQLTKEIPHGETITYKQLAERAGVPAGARAAGQALKRNRTPLLIPCHRVVAQGGKLGGFTGGIDWKKELLALEGIELLDNN